MPGVKVEYKASVAGDLGRLDPPIALRVLRKVERALSSAESEGERLSGDFAGLFRLRVGDYRVIYARTTEGYLVLRIGHLREVYRKGRP
ncbi:MAG: type II toxin-antitoxin system RelE family toxin [Acidobacteriota bacterium]